MKNNFIYQIENFEKIFEKNLTPTEKNSVEIFFAEISREFIQKLRKKVNFEDLENFDPENSFIEVSDEGQTRIYLHHKKDLGLQLNGIEIFITDEITIEFFYENHRHFAVVGNNSYFVDSKKVNKNEEKWDYSEIDDAVNLLSDSLHSTIKLVRVTWNSHVIKSGFLGVSEKGLSFAKFFRPIVFIQRIFMFWIKDKEEIIYVDWKTKAEIKK